MANTVDDGNQAEVALRALGMSLVWRSGFPDGIYREYVWDGKDGPNVYLVTSRTADDPFAEDPPDDASDEPIAFNVSTIGKVRALPHLTSYASLTEAKAACERHHATEKWD